LTVAISLQGLRFLAPTLAEATEQECDELYWVNVEGAPTYT